MAIWKRKITVSDDTVTAAVQLTTRQSLVPNLLGKMAPNWYIPTYAVEQCVANREPTNVPSYHLVFPLGLCIRYAVTTTAAASPHFFFFSFFEKHAWIHVADEKPETQTGLLDGK